MTHRIFIDGAAGTTGLEIAERLAGRPELDLLQLDDSVRKDSSARRDAMASADVTILCLPDDAAREAVAMAPADARIIDASSAHRVAAGWTYGFPEIVGRDAVTNAARVSNPGCYSTGFIALIAPLVRAGLLPADWAYTCNAVSGYSGGGNALIARYRAEPDLAFRTYALNLDHKHVPEMLHLCGLAYRPLFAPSVVPAFRGMLVEVPLPLAAMGVAASPADLLAKLAAFYADSPVVSVVSDAETPSEILLRADETPGDRLEIALYASLDGSQARLLARLDNLGKGAGGAAVQNLNLMLGLSETAGLRL